MDTRDLDPDRLQSEMKCQNCGRCCEQDMERAVSLEDMQLIANRFKMDLFRACAKYCKISNEDPDKMILKKSKPCVFRDEKNRKCKIYNVRPRVCRDYPILSQSYHGSLFVLYAECPACFELANKYGVNVLAEDQQFYSPDKYLRDEAYRHLTGGKCDGVLPVLPARPGSFRITFTQDNSDRYKPRLLNSFEGCTKEP